MKIGIVVDNEFNNDIRVNKEVKVLKSEGYNISVLCFGYTGIKYPERSDIAIERIHINRFIKNFLFVINNTIPIYNFLWSKRISKFIKKNKIDVLHAHDLYMSKASKDGIIKAKKNCALILDLHENYPAAVLTYNWAKGWFRNILAQPKLWEKKEEKYLNYADIIIVLSEDFQDLLSKKHKSLGSKKIIVYPNIIDLVEFNEFGIDKDLQRISIDTTLFYFGAIAERRGIFDALKAYKELVNNGLKLAFLIIGPIDKADNQKFYDMIFDDQIKDSIKYIPWISLSSLPSYLNIIDICLAPFHVNPQHESGVANKIFQYMSGGKPIIGSNCKPQRELIESSDCGFIYNSHFEFISHITKLSTHPEIREEQGKNGRRAIVELINKMNSDDALKSIYRDLNQTNN
jgi:glycosyltransferase involved in cell wall biosynthesis